MKETVGTVASSPAPDLLPDLVKDFYFSRTPLVASLAWLLYDYALTLEQEINFVWLKPWGISKILFLWTRYVGSCLLVLAVMGSILSGPIPQVCLLVYYCGGWGGLVTMATVSIIMALRVYAMYAGSRIVAATLTILLLVYLGAEGSMLYFSFGNPWFPPPEFLSLGLNACFGESTLRLSMGLWITRLGADGVMLGLAAYKSFQQYKQGWRGDIVELLIRDNILGFIFIMLVQILNLVLEGVAQPQATSAGIGFAIATDVIVGARLLLNTREALYLSSPVDSIQLSQLAVRPVIVLSNHCALSMVDDSVLPVDLSTIGEEMEESEEAGVTPIEDVHSARALVFGQRRPS